MKDQNPVSDEEVMRKYLEKIQNIPLLFPDEEADLARLASEGDKDAQIKLVEANLVLVTFIAKEYIRDKFSFLDIVQKGNIGLLNAVELYNPAESGNFTQYVIKWIKKEIERTNL